MPFIPVPTTRAGKSEWRIANNGKEAILRIPLRHSLAGNLASYFFDSEKELLLIKFASSGTHKVRTHRKNSSPELLLPPFVTALLPLGTTRISPSREAEGIIIHLPEKRT